MGKLLVSRTKTYRGDARLPSPVRAVGREVPCAQRPLLAPQCLDRALPRLRLRGLMAIPEPDPVLAAMRFRASLADVSEGSTPTTFVTVGG